MVSIYNPVLSPYPSLYSPEKKFLADYPDISWIDYSDKSKDLSSLSRFAKVPQYKPMKWIDTQPMLVQTRPNIVQDYEYKPIIEQPVDDGGFDKQFNTDPEFGLPQEWLLFQRQGDEYDRLPERRPYPELAYETEFNLPVTTLNMGRVWYGIPKLPTIPESKFYRDYQEALEYSQTQLETEYA
jgi:hypothetical protein